MKIFFTIFSILSVIAIFIVIHIVFVGIKIMIKPTKKHCLKTRLLKKLRKQAKKKYRIKKGYYTDDGGIKKIGYIITYNGENVFYIQKDYNKYFPNVPYGLEYTKALLEEYRRTFITNHVSCTKSERKKKEIERQNERQIKKTNKELSKL